MGHILSELLPFSQGCDVRKQTTEGNDSSGDVQLFLEHEGKAGSDEYVKNVLRMYLHQLQVHRKFKEVNAL
jgi:hypothetical protein